MSDYVNSLVIFSGSAIESMGIKNLLESKGVGVFEVNALMSSIEPWAVSPGGFGASVLKVQEEDYDNAVKIIADYNNGVNDLDA